MTKDQLGMLIIGSERQMYCTAKTILKNDEDCADAVQETIVKAFLKIDTLKKDKYAKTWLIRILINECYNLLRRERKLTLLESVSGVSEAQTEEKKDYSDLYQAVNLLKEELKLPVVLYYAEEFSIREIAQILDISEGAVQKRLARARAQLKIQLERMEVLV
jgi:RNA polymerase sigma-70 factor (ECF subfamily)